jgi:hypothetical protein
MLPQKSFITLDIFKVYAGGVALTPPSDFQTSIKGSLIGNWSILDSCSSAIHMPTLMHDDFVNRVRASGGVSPALLNSASFTNVSLIIFRSLLL